MRLHFALVGMALLPAMAASGESAAPSCVGALEQITTLQTWTPVYRQSGNGQQQYINDADRPAEVARLQKIVDANCNADPQARRGEQSEAQRLHILRSPKRAIERDKLSFMEKPGSRDPPDTVAAQRKLVTEKCPLVEIANVWLLQMVYVRR